MTETETQPELEEKDDDDSGYPGIIIIFSNPDDVHAALGLGSVANIVLPSNVAPNVPVLQQGKLKERCVHSYKEHGWLLRSPTSLVLNTNGGQLCCVTEL